MKYLNSLGLKLEDNFYLRTLVLRTEIRSLKSRNRSPGIVVNIVTKLETGDSGVLSPGGVKFYLFSTKLPNGLWGHPWILSNE